MDNPKNDYEDATVSEAFKTISQESRKLKYSWTDKGSEVYKEHLQNYEINTE